MGLNFAGIKFRGWSLPRNSNISRGFNFADGLLSDFSRISRMGTPDFWWISRNPVFFKRQVGTLSNEEINSVCSRKEATIFSKNSYKVTHVFLSKASNTFR